VRPTIGRELLLAALAMAERGPRLAIAHVSCAFSCLSDPARWDHRRRSRGLFCEHNGLRKPALTCYQERSMTTTIRCRSSSWRQLAGRACEVRGKAGTRCAPAPRPWSLSLAGASRRPALLLQLLLQLVEKAPVRALSDDFQRVRLDHAHLVQAQGIEAQRILGVVFVPLEIR
jgi:hypothetical protein